MACMFYFASCINIIFNSLLAQLVKCDVHTTRKIKSIHSIFIKYYYCILLTNVARCSGERWRLASTLFWLLCRSQIM